MKTSISQLQAVQLKLVIILLLISMLILCACTPSSSEIAAEEVNSKTEVAKVYTPPPGYAPSGKDPLLALYGGKKSKSGANLGDKEIKARFDQINEVKLSKAFPVSWRRAISALSKDFALKVIEWSSTTGTRMERGLQNRALSLKVKVLGPKSELLVQLPSHLSAIPALQKIPKRLGDQHEHSEDRGAEKLSVNYSLLKSTEHKANPLSIATLDIKWRREKAQPSPLDKNCRYVHGLTPDLGSKVVDWAAQHFKSTSTRRFVEWTEEQSPTEKTWRATWIYRNGSYRDKAVGWWTDLITKRGAKQISMSGMEQVWSLKGGGSIEWWPETDPSPMGCEVAGPLLTISSTISHE